MPSIAYKFAHRRVLVVEEFVDEWQIDNEQAPKIACDTEELVRETADLLKPVERVVSLIDDGPQDHTDGDPRFLVLVHHVGCLLNKSIGLFSKVNRFVEDVQRRGFTIKGLDDLERSKNALSHIRDSFFKSWPLPDQKIVRIAKQELKEGRFRVL